MPLYITDQSLHVLYEGLDESNDELDADLLSEQQKKSRKSLSKDKTPSTSANWLISSDDDTLVVYGTLSHVIRFTKIPYNKVDEAMQLCLDHGCLWVTPCRGSIFFTASPVEAAEYGINGDSCTITHNPSLAKFYINGY